MYIQPQIANAEKFPPPHCCPYIGIAKWNTICYILNISCISAEFYLQIRFHNLIYFHFPYLKLDLCVARYCYRQSLGNIRYIAIAKKFCTTIKERVKPTTIVIMM